MRALLQCLCCRETAEHVVEADGEARLAWCQRCFRVWRSPPPAVAADRPAPPEPDPERDDR
jgi:hypothetical protein